MRLVPNSESLREANSCHSPAGSPKGGQFCSEKGVESPAFKAWFGDWQDPLAWSSKRPKGSAPVSMAVGEDGRPLVLYHSTRGSFDTFEVGRKTHNSNVFGSYETTRYGIFATADVSASQAYIDERHGSNVMPVYFQAFAPLDLRRQLTEDELDSLMVSGDVTNRRWLDQQVDAWELFDSEHFVKALKAAGYDSAVFYEEHHGRDDGNRVETWVVLDPSQVKSAIGNRGTWSKRSKKITESALFREYNQCHDPASGKFASPREVPCGQPKELASHLPRHIPKVDRNAPFGTEGLLTYTETVIDDKGVKSERLKWHNVQLPGGRMVQLKGEILDDAALHGKLLFHVTGALDAVLSSGKLIAFENGGGLGGGNHPAVSFTASRATALNILDVMTEMKRAVEEADAATSNEDGVARLEAQIKEWSGRELRALAKAKYPPLPGDSPLDRVPMRVFKAIEGGLEQARLSYVNGVAANGGNRAAAAVDAMRNWLWSRDTAGLGENPVLFGGPKNYRGKQFGLLAVPTRNLPKSTMVNYGADKFQSEVEVHGDVPIAGAYFLTRKPRRSKWSA